MSTHVAGSDDFKHVLPHSAAQLLADPSIPVIRVAVPPKMSISERWTFWSAIGSLCAALCSAFAGTIAIWSIHQTSAQFHMDERAWIEPELSTEKTGFDAYYKAYAPPGGDPQNAAPIASIFKVSLRNVGKTVARNVTLKLERGRNDEPDALDEAKVARKLDHLDERETRRELFSAIPKTLAPNTATPLDAKLFPDVEGRDEDGFVHEHYILGRIDYSDVFGKKHWVTFCYITDGRNLFVRAPFGNDEDGS